MTHLTDSELVSGLVLGLDDVSMPVAVGTPVQALAAALRPALLRPPCVLAFSGGRDSSLLLAVATREAHRLGVAPPIAATLEFDSEATHERSWQEIVIDHLGLRDWRRLPQGDVLDFVGPVAARGLRRHGVMFPANAHMVVPLAGLGPGGSVVTGLGGDDVLGNWRFHDVASLIAGRRHARLTDLRRVPIALAPAFVRAEVFRRQTAWCHLPWLREPHRHAAAARISAELVSAPRRWHARARWMARRRQWRVAEEAVRRLGADAGVAVHAPLLAPGFLTALGAAGGRWGWGNRTELMAALFGDLLPDATLRRHSKAEFSEPYFGPYTRRLVQRWDGSTGIDATVVDGEALRSMWLAPRPSALSAALLQSIWLAHAEGSQ